MNGRDFDVLLVAVGVNDLTLKLGTIVVEAYPNDLDERLRDFRGQ